MKTKAIWIPICAGVALIPRLCLSNGTTSAPPVVAASSNAPAATATDTNLPTMEVNQAVMVTVELEFSSTLPSIAEALTQIERKYEPADGKGRTFAILDAYGGPTPDGKKLHISMHVSTEKTGVAMLVFKRTAEVLWKTKIVPATHPPSSSFAGKGLNIVVNDVDGKPRLVNGSKVKTSIFEGTLNDSGEPLDTFWPSGDEREVTFFFSACGCPVKVMAKREGDKTVRTKDLPVIFPDDYAVAATITKLMGWEK